MIDEILVYEDLDYENNEELLKFLAQELHKKEYVGAGYMDALLERESKYPTGIYTGEINVALPHVDYDEVYKSSISISTFKDPVHFNRMDNPAQKLEVNIVFLLTIKSSENHLEVLSKLSQLISDQNKLKELLSCDKQEVEKLVRKELSK